MNLDFSDLEPTSVPFTYQGQNYLLKEATGDTVRRFNNERARRLTYGENGNVTSIQDMGDLEIKLLSMCITTAEGNKLPESVIGSWPSRMVSKLYVTAQEISYMIEPESAFSTLLENLNDLGPEEESRMVTWMKSLKNDEINRELRIYERNKKAKE